jgi:hypothetical protein
MEKLSVSADGLVSPRTISGAMNLGVPSILGAVQVEPTLSLSQISTSPVAGSTNRLPSEMSQWNNPLACNALNAATVGRGRARDRMGRDRLCVAFSEWPGVGGHYRGAHRRVDASRRGFGHVDTSVPPVAVTTSTPEQLDATQRQLAGLVSSQ